MDTTINERNKINNLKCLLIFLVVYGHFIGRLTDSNLAKELYKFIYLFHMPIFVFISGYLYNKSRHKSFKDTINCTLVPYLIFQILYIIFKLITGYGNQTYNVLIELFIPGSVHWYLLCLFYWRIIIHKVKFSTKNTIIICFIPLITGLISFIGDELALAKGLNYFMYFYFGYYLNQTKKNIFKIKLSGKYQFLMLTIISIFVMLFYKSLTVNQITVVESYYDLNLSYLNGMINRVAIYILSISLGTLIINCIPDKKYIFTYIGERTLGIYLLHNYFIYITYYIIGDYGLTVSLILSILVTYCLSINVVYKFLNKFIDIFIISYNSKFFKNLKNKTT